MSGSHSFPNPRSLRVLCTDLVEVDDRLPEPIVHLVEVPHTHFTEVTGMVLVHVCTVVVLATGKTTTTWMLPVLADTTVTGRDVAATVVKMLVLLLRYDRSIVRGERRDWFAGAADDWWTYCLRVFVALVGIAMVLTVQC